MLGTLVGQGLLLPLLIRRLGFDADPRDEDREAKARLLAARAALRRLDELGAAAWVGEEEADRIGALYRLRARTAKARLDDDDGIAEAAQTRTQAARRLRREAIAAERRELVRLRDTGKLPADVLQRIEHDLDLEEARLVVG